MLPFAWSTLNGSLSARSSELSKAPNPERWARGRMTASRISLGLVSERR